MKFKLILLLIVISSTIYGQDIFPDYDTSLISGKELKVKPTEKHSWHEGYVDFYKDEKLKKTFACCEGISSNQTKKSALVEKVFKVVSIIPYTDYSEKTKFKLKLSNPEIGNIYFDYDPKYESNWPFQFVGNFTIPADFYCRKIQITADKFTGDTTFETPTASGFTFTKVKNKNKATIYLRKNIANSALSIEPKGVILLLENGLRIEKPNEVLGVHSSGAGYSGYYYTAFFELSESDIKILSENAVTDARLYIYDGTVKPEDGKLIIAYLKCLLNK